MSCSSCTLYSTTTSYTSTPYSWLDDLPDTSGMFDIVEVKFKSTRKEFFRNTDRLLLQRGDKVVVGCSPGYDIGEVALTGYLADKQFRRKISNPDRYETGPIFRKANTRDIQNYQLAKDREQEILIESRKIANQLNLDMKVGDVEVRADNGKAIFYYIADGRIDYRQLIKDYAAAFKLRIEMKQIGARQEAARVGGIGSCGRELCCSSWRTGLASVSSESLTLQGLSPSAQKMAGQCGKLKCCLLYELDAYAEAGKEFPQQLLYLETAQGVVKPFKTDYLAKKVWYVSTESSASKTYTLNLEEVKQYIQDNKKGIKPDLENKDKISTASNAFVAGKSDITNDQRSKGRSGKRKKFVRASSRVTN